MHFPSQNLGAALEGNYKWKPRPPTSSRNLQSWNQDMGYLPHQRPFIMVATSGCRLLSVHSKFGGRCVLVLKSTKDMSRPKKYMVVQLSVTFIGRGTFVPEIHKCYRRIDLQDASVQFCFTPVCTSCICISLRKGNQHRRSTYQRST